MIRVGFILNFRNNEWLGGTNYFRNLIGSLYTNPDRNLEPVIFTGYDCSDNRLLESYPAITVIKDHIFDVNHPHELARRALKMLFHRDILLERLLSKYAISVLSHSVPLGKRSSVLTVGWIPDFQHKHLPEFFSAGELNGRDKVFQNICAESTRVIFSSNAAKTDAEKYYPEYKDKYRVLHFVTGSMDLSNLPDFILIKEQYKITEPYFIVPNQFWAHKNHDVILEALRILKTHNHPVHVIATGNTSDYRQPGFFGALQKKIHDYDIGTMFLVIGVVPYNDLLQIMIHATAVINPSLFEGWSTSVEETKALNLNVILSDIPVHREQNPKNGIFFKPHDAQQLADILIACVQREREPNFGKEQLIQISEKLTRQQREFAENYEKIVLDMVKDTAARQ